mgnify:CR=1 FL=1
MSESSKKQGKQFRFTVGFAVKCALALIAVVYFVFLIFGGSMFDAMSMFYRSLNIFGNAGEYNIIIRIVSYAIFILSISWVVRFALKLVSERITKGRALMDILSSLIKYVSIIVLIFFILKTAGVDTTSILAGIGIMGLVVGLGAQPLIADILAGLFIIFENVFEVGDIIVADGFRGTVKEIGIRTTKIIDTGGNIKIMNNADLKSIVNMTNQLSLAICDIGIEYGESLERVEAILKDNLDAIKEAIPDIKEGPFYKGVAELADSAVVIRFVAQCDEGTRYQVERDMNRQFKLLFDKNNINIPFPQIVLNQPTTFENVSKQQQEQAGEFVKDQKVMSKGLADDDSNSF